MGIKLFRISGDKYLDADAEKAPVLFLDPPNPDPANYEILATKEIYDFLIVKIRYPDCTNYEGKKILVYYGVSMEDLDAQRLIDPHFSDNKNFFSPIARFEPTKRGLKLAIKLPKQFCRCVGVHQWKEIQRRYRIGSVSICI